jgi:predicted helicase
MDGMRKSLAAEFSNLYVLHLRGNARTQGEVRRREKDNVFGQGSRQPVVILILVKNPSADHHGVIRFHDIGDYLTQDQKLSSVATLGSIGGLGRQVGWTEIVPNDQGDWLGQRGSAFDAFLPLGSRDGSEPDSVFENFTQGVLTARDAWCVNSSRHGLEQNVEAMVAAYKEELQRFQKGGFTFPNAKAREAFVDEFVTQDTHRISWSRALKASLGRGREIDVNEAGFVKCHYRPFQQQHLYFDKNLNEVQYQMPSIFPGGSGENLLICIAGAGERAGSALMVNSVSNFHTMDTAQCFPRYLYDLNDEAGTLFGSRPNSQNGSRRDAISIRAVNGLRSHYSDDHISADDIFYFIYGILHSPAYRDEFGDNLRKQLPRIPRLSRAADFWTFSEAGRKLGELHCDYEKAEPYPVTLKEGDLSLAVIDDPEAFYRVEKMKFGGKRPNLDKSTVVYNPRITMTNVPLEAYDYVVNGKSALEWVMERQVVKTDPASGIVNDANRYAIETVGDPAYPLKLFQRVITVSLETMKIVRSLPALDIMVEDGAMASTKH